MGVEGLRILEKARERFGDAFRADMGADAILKLLARLDLVSQMARLRVASGWERLVVPAFVYFFAQLYPFRRINRPGGRTAVTVASLPWPRWKSSSAVTSTSRSSNRRISRAYSLRLRRCSPT